VKAPTQPHHLFIANLSIPRIQAAALLSLIVFVCGCAAIVTQRYSISAENIQTIKSLGATEIGVGTFSDPAIFDARCRLDAKIELADAVTPAQYVQRAFEDELKMAGAYAQASPRVTLTGNLTRLEVSSSTKSLDRGSWKIDLNLISSNGHRMSVAEYYEFPSGQSARLACRQTADAFSRAVQNLIGKAVHSSEFALLVK
jgi:hypothetical protein